MVKYLPITSEIKQKLREEHMRTGVASSSLLRHCNQELPEGLTIQMPGNWLRGACKSASPIHLDFVFQAYAKLPTPVDSIKIDDEICEKLQCEIDRTGVLPGRALGQAATDRPEELSSYKVRGWLLGARPSVPRDHLEYLLERYASFPDKPASYTPITEAFCAELADLRQKSGTSYGALLKLKEKSNPTGLSANVIYGWMSGTAKAGRADQMDWVIAQYRTLSESPDRLDLTAEMWDSLFRWRDLGLLPSYYFSEATKIPSDLSYSIVGNWLTQNTKSASKVHFDHVSTFCEAALENPETRVRLNAEMRLRLRQCLAKQRDQGGETSKSA